MGRVCLTRRCAARWGRSQPAESANVAIIARGVTPGDAANTGSLTATNQPPGQHPVHASATVTVAAATPPSSPVVAPTISSGGLGQIDQHALVQTVPGAAPAPTIYWVQYGTSTQYGQSTPIRQLQGEGGSMLELLRALKAGVVYHFRAVAQNSAGQTFGQDESLRRSAAADRPWTPACRSMAAARIGRWS